MTNLIQSLKVNLSQFHNQRANPSPSQESLARKEKQRRCSAINAKACSPNQKQRVTLIAAKVVALVALQSSPITLLSRKLTTRDTSQAKQAKTAASTNLRRKPQKKRIVIAVTRQIPRARASALIKAALKEENEAVDEERMKQRAASLKVLTLQDLLLWQHSYRNS
jgi:cell wall-associated NlpC family hydrolase